MAKYDSATDTTTLVEHYVFDAFGNLISAEDGQGNPLTGGPSTRYLFTAQEFDPDTGLYYYDNRWYNPTTARFISADPIQDDHNNTYRYVGNAATIYVDPSGLEGIAKKRHDYWTEPIYTPIPRWARESGITSLPFAPNADAWDGSANHPNSTTRAEIVQDMQWLLFEATVTCSPVGPAGKEVAKRSRGIISKFVARGKNAGAAAAREAGERGAGTAVRGKGGKVRPNTGAQRGQASTGNAQPVPQQRHAPRTGAKRGPKTDPNAPHNAKIRSEADRLEAEGNTILRGGGRQKEQLIPTPGGKKTGRRPDILYRTPNGQLRGCNVGKAKVDGTPVTREVDALDDLNNFSDVPTDFVPYNR